MIEVECLVCGKVVKLPQFIDTENYDGQVVCQECDSLLYIKLVRSKVQGYKVVKWHFRNFGITGAKEKLRKTLDEMHERAEGK